MKNRQNNESDEFRRLLKNSAQSFSMLSMVRGEVALWRAVLLQALIDATCRSAKPEARFQRREALEWLTGNGRDFAMVCDLAQVNPVYMRRMVKRCLMRREDRLNAARPPRGRKIGPSPSIPAGHAENVVAVLLIQG